MLQEKLNECRILISEVSRNKQIDQENKNTVKKNNTFFDAYQNYFVPTIKSYVLCKDCEGVEFSETVTSGIKKYMEYSKQVFEQKTVLEPEKYQEGVKKLRDSIEKEWSEQINTNLADIKEDLGILKLVSNNKMEIQKILTCLNNFSKWPLEDEMMQQYEIAKVRANEILAEMKFDDEISGFLKKVKDKEATLLDLTDSIIEWIRQEELSGNIMLSIKN